MRVGRSRLGDVDPQENVIELVLQSLKRCFVDSMGDIE